MPDPIPVPPAPIPSDGPFFDGTPQRDGYGDEIPGSPWPPDPQPTVETS